MTDKKFSCLIPFYNESTRILPVLKTITEVPLISQIVCVDDGSTDNIAETIQKIYPNITLIRLVQNYGKSTAIQKGIEAVVNEYVLLMDADLKKVKEFEITAALKAISEHDHIDMMILRRINAPWFVKLDRSDILFSGERILKKTDLANILTKSVMRYQLEIAINIYMQENGKNVYWMPSSALNTYKIKKMGLLNGLAKEKSMFADIISYAGWGTFFKQIITFGRNRMIVKYKS